MNNDRIWLLLTRKLSGEASASELQELDLLLQQNEDALKTAEDVAAVWWMNETTDEDFLEATYLLHLKRIDAIRPGLDNKDLSGQETAVFASGLKNILTLKKLMIPAIIILIMGCCWAFFPLLDQPTPAPVVAANVKEVITPNGARSKITLPDGSNVWLNSGSRLHFKNVFDKEQREVYLSGEAFFDVVKDLQRPFIIHTDKIDVKVVGTRFNIKAYRNDKTSETSLVQGVIEVFVKSNLQKKYRLQPNEKLVLENSEQAIQPANEKNTEASNLKVAETVIQIKKLTYIKGTTTDVESSWTKNILSFEDEVFAEVANKMERWYDVSIEFKNKKWENAYLNGSFEKETLEQAMEAIKFSTGFNYTIRDKKVFIY